MAEFFVRQRTLEELRRGRSGKVIELDVDVLDRDGHFVILYFPNNSTLTFAIATLLDAIDEEKQVVRHQKSAQQFAAHESGAGTRAD